MSRSLRHGSRIGAVALATLALVLATGVPAGAVPGVDPPSVATNLPPGGSTTVTKAVETPPVGSSVLDVYFLADTTGSMGSSLANVQASIADILAAVDTGATDVRFGAGDYKDFACDPVPFNSAAPIPAADDDGAAATAAVTAWSASGGCDTPEAGLFALEALATGDAGFRVGALPVIVWFGDAPSHDPICASVTGGATDVTEASATAALQAAGAKVIAVSTTSGPGLDDDPGTAGYGTGCSGTGSAGQAGRITAATGGLSFSGVDPDGVADAILSGLASLPVTVAPSATCDPGLSLAFDAPSKTVTGGDVATFTETATASPTATVGSTLSCTVDWLLDGAPGGPAFVQTLNVTIGGTAPTGVVVKLNGRPHCADHRSAVRTRLVVKPRSATSVVSVDSSAMRVTNVSKAPNSWVVHLKSTTGNAIPAHSATVVVRTAGGDQSFTVDVPAFTCV
jgi:hypothetical protein